MKNKTTIKSFFMNILNGISVGAVVSLVPSALLGNLMLALKPIFPLAQTVINLTQLSMILLAPISALISARLFELTPIQSASLALVAITGAGNWRAANGAFVFGGAGDVINIILTLMLAVLFLKLAGNRLKAYNILLLPTLMLVIVGSISVWMFPYTSQITSGIGALTEQITQIQPLLMGILMAIIFSVLIVTPISTVALALAISLSGVASGAANLGVTACGFTLAFLGLSANGMGTALVHFLGSPKVQMANVAAKPISLLPIVINAAILGGLGTIFDMKGTPLSAGFGFSGLVGPLAAYNGSDKTLAQVIIIAALFFVIPIILGLLARLIFIKKLHLFSDQDLKLDFD